MAPIWFIALFYGEGFGLFEIVGFSFLHRVLRCS